MTRILLTTLATVSLCATAVIAEEKPNQGRFVMLNNDGEPVIWLFDANVGARMGKIGASVARVASEVEAAQAEKAGEKMMGVDVRTGKVVWRVVGGDEKAKSDKNWKWIAGDRVFITSGDGRFTELKTKPDSHQPRAVFPIGPRITDEVMRRFKLAIVAEPKPNPNTKVIRRGMILGPKDLLTIEWDDGKLDLRNVLKKLPAELRDKVEQAMKERKAVANPPAKEKSTEQKLDLILKRLDQIEAELKTLREK